MFRDQTSSVAQNMRSREVRRRKKANVSANKIVLPDDSGSRSDTRDHYLDLARRQPLRPVSLHPSLEDCATCYFISNHVVGMHSSNVGYLDSLINLYKTQTAGPCLIASVTAASLAAFAHHMKNDSFEAAARRYYTKAISLTSAALSHSEDVKKDSTLVSVLILGQYEIIAGDNERSKEAYEEHTNGAATLLKIRGPAQLKSPFGPQLLIEVMRNILATCYWRSIRIPDHITDFVRRAYRNAPTYSAIGSVYDAIIEASDFYAFVRSNRRIDYHDAISKALKIDVPLADVCTNSPGGRECQTWYDESADPSTVFKGRYDTCEFIGWWNLWMAIRTIRIMLHEGIQDAVLHSYSARAPASTREELISQFKKSSAVCQQMREDILAGIPQNLGYVDKRDGKYFITDQPTTWPARAYSLIWPIWVSARMETTPDVRSYCIRCAEEIGTRLGIQQGSVIAKALKERHRLMSGDFRGADRWTRFQALISQAPDTDRIYDGYIP